jgi:pimeloyl-ACP methyl ester carboxylesterase
VQWIAAILGLICWAWAAGAQAPAVNPPINGVHYSFERLVVERQVDDDRDQGRIALVSYVYRPLQNDRGEVIVSLHGSTGGLLIDPAEPILGPAPSLWFLLRNGFTVVVPMRRGRAESAGHYVEECPYQAGKCSLADYRELTARGLADALASTETVIEQGVLPRLKPKSGKVILWGSSRGGLLALHYAGKHPHEVAGVVAASPGWLSMSDKWPAAENDHRLQLQKRILAEAGAAYRGPTFWVYADGDPFYPEPLTRQLFAAFRATGGRGDYLQIRDHKLASGHVPPVDLWGKDAEAFLQKLH